MIVANKKFSKNKLCIGSALILAVVLTSLLAIVGVMFLMVARVDRMATSAVSQQKELNLAVDTIIERISGQLIRDVPGVNLPGWGLPEYYDYPGPLDRWLASLEPNDSRMWRQISDVTGYLLQFRGWPTNDIPIAKIADHSPILLHPADGSLLEQLADADGDGAGDSKWFVLDNMTSGKGIPIYAAIRVVDNGGMLNINTAFKFDPCDPDIARIDGSSQLQINLMALANRPDILHTPADEMALLLTRANYGVGLDPNNLTLYENNVIWQYGELPLPYTPFDISDELELRNRFLLNQRDIDTRIERLGWTGSFLAANLMVPIGQGGSSSTVDDWFARANISVDVPPAPSRYDYRHIATAYSMDRIINPLGPKFFNGKMVNVNNPAFKGLLHSVIMTGFLDADPNLARIAADGLAAQIAANIIDFYDSDSQVAYLPDANGTMYYGFETPCIYISELAARIVTGPRGEIIRSYAVELHKPYFEDDDPVSGQWKLAIGSNVISIDWSGTRRFHVIQMEGRRAATDLLTVTFNDPNEPADPNSIFGYVPRSSPAAQDERGRTFSAGSVIQLRRLVDGVPIVVDSYTVPSSSPASGWLITDGGAHSIQRDITRHKCIRRLWDVSSQADAPTLGQPNTFTDSADPGLVQAHPYLDPAIYRDKGTGRVGFKNIGEIGMVFFRSGYNVPPSEATEIGLRLDFQNLLFANLLNYLTVIDPATHPPLRWDETRIKGRININTAPPFVIGQLPWMNPAVATSIVAWRDKTVVPGGPDYRARLGYLGFRNIGQLTWVPEMGYYAFDGKDQQGFPDLTPLKLLGNADGSPDDFEERDLIFHRISNLVTVRSDVFTAYILVRIGPDGPQKRVIAILDRSQVDSPNDRVRIIALHPVPDPW